jgi:hypothetical protein
MADKEYPLVAEDGSVVSRLLVEMADGTFAERVEAYPPQKLLTDEDGPSARLRVDVGQTGFFAGREFRTFLRFSLAHGSSLYLRFSCSTNFILFEEEISLKSGELDHTAYRVVTDVAGSWTQRPTIGRNIMTERPTPVFVPTGKLEYGGSFTVDAANEVGPPMIPKTAGATAQQTTTPAGSSRERGLAAGTYYLKITSLSGTAEGVYYLDWEERP